MRILVLDDDPDRHKAFQRNLYNHEVVSVLTYDAFIEAVTEQNRFDLAFLDRDLNMFEAKSLGPVDSMYGEVPRELTGEDVVVWLLNDCPSEKMPMSFHVHSWNPDPAIRMESRLRAAGHSVTRFPFHEKMGLDI